MNYINRNVKKMCRISQYAALLLLFGYQSLVAQVMVKDIAPGATGSEPSKLIRVGATIYFTAKNAATGRELYKTNGTAAGTVLIKDIVPGPAGSFQDSYLEEFIAVGNTLYFTMNDGIHGYELWKSDGTESGTVLIKDILPGTLSAKPQDLTNVGGILYFSANSRDYGREVWKSDGTEAGTVLVKDIKPGVHGSNPFELTAYNGALFFGADNGVSGQDLWKTDGTPAGTELVKNLPHAKSGMNFMQVMGAALYFIEHGDSPAGKHLYRSDGTTAGTKVIKGFDPIDGKPSTINSMVKVGNVLYMINQIGDFPDYPIYSLYKSDGTKEGTQVISTVNSENLKYSATVFGGLRDVGGKLYLSAYIDSWYGPELYGSTPEASGIGIIKDILPGEFGSGPSGITPVGKTFYFQGFEHDHGPELWKSDGTEAGTVMVKDIKPGQEGGGASYITAGVGAVYFVANNGVHGEELWKVSIPFMNPDDFSEKAIGNTETPNSGRIASAEAKLAEEMGLQVKVYPNPATDYLSVELHAPATDPVATTITDMTGKVYLQNNHQMAGGNQLQLNVTSLKPGMYLMQIAAGSRRKSLKFVKQ